MYYFSEPENNCFQRIRASGGLSPTKFDELYDFVNPEKAVYMDLVSLSLRIFGFSSIRPYR